MDIQNAAPAEKGKKAGKEKKKKSEQGEAVQGKKARKKRRGRGLVIMLAVLVLALLVTAVYVIIHFNIDGWRDRLITAVNSLDPIYVENKIRIYDLEDRARDATLREKELEAAERELETRVAEVERREMEVDVEVTTKESIFKGTLTDDDILDLQNLAKTYAAMEPKTAAVILATLYNIEDMAIIIYYMKPAAAALILTEMDVRLAAQITEQLLTE